MVSSVLGAAVTAKAIASPTREPEKPEPIECCPNCKDTLGAFTARCQRSVERWHKTAVISSAVRARITPTKGSVFNFGFTGWKPSYGNDSIVGQFLHCLYTPREEGRSRFFAINTMALGSLSAVFEYERGMEFDLGLGNGRIPNSEDIDSLRQLSDSELDRYVHVHLNVLHHAVEHAVQGRPVYNIARNWDSRERQLLMMHTACDVTVSAYREEWWPNSGS